MFTRLSVSVFIHNKTPQEVAENVPQHWIGAGSEVMESILVDNGGELNNEEIHEMSSMLIIRISSTPGQIPWNNS